MGRQSHVEALLPATDSNLLPRFTESPHSFFRMQWDHEATLALQEGSRTAWPVPLLGGVRGAFVTDTFMENGNFESTHVERALELVVQGR